MIETLITGLALAAVSAITFIAYKHPSAYRKVYHPLTYVISAILIVMGIWTFSAQSAYTQLIPLIEASKLHQMEEWMGRITYRWWVVFAACVGANLYLLMLSRLPKLFAQDLEQEKKDSPEDPSLEKKDGKI